MNIEATSLNHAFILLSEAFETKRLAMAAMSFDKDSRFRMIAGCL